MFTFVPMALPPGAMYLCPTMKHLPALLALGALACSTASPPPQAGPAPHSSPAPPLAPASAPPPVVSAAPETDGGAGALMAQKRRELEAREQQEAARKKAEERVPSAPFSLKVAGFFLTMRPRDFAEACQKGGGMVIPLDNAPMVGCTKLPDPPPFYVDSVVGRFCDSGTMCELYLRLWGVNVEKPSLAQRSKTLKAAQDALLGKYGQPNYIEGQTADASELPSMCFAGHKVAVRYVWSWMIKPQSREDFGKIGRLIFAYKCDKTPDDIDDTASIIYQDFEQIIDRIKEYNGDKPDSLPVPTGNGAFLPRASHGHLANLPDALGYLVSRYCLRVVRNNIGQVIAS